MPSIGSSRHGWRSSRPSHTPAHSPDAFAEQVERDEYRGCHLINSLVEFPAGDHPVRRFALERNAQWRAYLRELVRDAGRPDADPVADQLFLLLEGAFVAAAMERSTEPMRRARRAAEALLSIEREPDHRSPTGQDTK